MQQNKSVIEKSDKYILNTYARFPLALTHGKNAAATDADGKHSIDFGSGVGVNSLGYCDDEWVKAVSDQAAEMSHISNYYYSPIMANTAEALCKLSKMAGVFFANSGAEANEGAIKLARKYSFDNYGKDRHNIITLKNSFHGRTMATLSATGQESLHKDFYPFLKGFIYAKTNDIDNTISLMDKSVAAIILEPILGEGGVIPLTEEYVSAVAAAAKKRDILLIFDEVQCGAGRTGTFLAAERLGVAPDIVTLAKGLGGGLPIGAFLCTKRLKNVLTPGTHGSTFGGNPICCAGALAVLNRIKSPGFLTEVTRKGALITEFLKELNSPFIKEIRGAGLMIGAVLEGISARKIADALFSEGLLALTAKGEVLRFLPPLTINESELFMGLSIIKKVFDRLKEGRL